MTRTGLIIRSLWHFRRRNLTVALGMAISMAVITGALVTGDSVSAGLRALVGIRLGQADLAITSGDRYFTDSLSVGLSNRLSVPATSLLQARGSASAQGGTLRVPRVEIYGIDTHFARVTGPGTFHPPVNEGDAVIGDNLASRLNVAEGDEIIVRIEKPGPVPVDAPFVSGEDHIVSASLKIVKIAAKQELGRFHLQNTQTAPLNIFVNRGWLQKLTGAQGLSNLILLAGDGKVTASKAEKILNDARTLGDAGLHLDKHPVTGEWVLRTPRIFFDPPGLKSLETIPGKELYFSYFINEFRCGSYSTPYSFVSTLPSGKIKPGEILINRWMADDLSAKAGDSISLTYFMVGPLRNLTEQQSKFRIAGIIGMEDPACDRLLMPEIPGLSDAGNCRDWETGIPINLDKIRDKDELYWKTYRGTPKAFIDPETAYSLWHNQFGSYTQVRFPAGSDPVAIGKTILDHLSPAESGILIKESRKEGNRAASGGVDFSGLFLGLSFFLIAGGIILTILLIRLGLEGRAVQIGSLKALGWPEQQIRRLYLWETSLVAVAGTLFGVLLTWGYTSLIFKALNGVWNDIVLTDTLRPVYKPGTLALGIVISLLVSVGTTWLVISRFFKRKTNELIRKIKRETGGFRQKWPVLIATATGLTALLLAGYGIPKIGEINPVFFFTSGTLLLISLISWAIQIFRSGNTGISERFGLMTIGWSNLRRNRNRSLSVVLLFAIGIFLVIGIGANRKGPDPEGTGRFLFYLETTVPVTDNLNNEAVRNKYGLETPSEFVQMKKLAGDDASCLNLNRVSNPPLLGVPKGSLNGRFRFVSIAGTAADSEPWDILEQELPGGAIPAVADQTVIQWGLGLKPGDTLTYKSESGETLKLVLVGGLANSIFQGHILISGANFQRHWPSVSGTGLLLISADPASADQVQTEITRVFRDYGPDLKTTAQKLSEFNSVENTYLSIFLVMGALAMLLGTIGLAVILLRNLQERRSEIALLRASGFSRRRILRLIAGEYSVLLIFGTLAGGLPSLITVLPVMLNPFGRVSPVFLAAILLILLLNGLVWILALSWQVIRQPQLIRNLREE